MSTAPTPTMPRVQSTKPLPQPPNLTAVFVDALETQHGGTEHQLALLLEYLLDTDHQILLLTLKQEGPLPTQLQNRERLTHHNLALSSWFSVKGLYELLRQLRLVAAKQTPDICMGFLRDGNIASWLASRLIYRCPNIASKRYFAYLTTSASRSEQLKERLLERIYGHSECTVVNADATCRQIKSDNENANVLTIKNAIECSDRISNADLSKSYDLVCISNLRPIKELDTLIDAMPKILKQHPQTRLAIIGEGPERRKLENRISSMNLSESVSLLGFIGVPDVYLSNARIGILCSSAEGSPNAILEYMCAALPIVATNVGGVSELITDGENGYLIGIRQPNQLTAKVCALLGDSSLCARFGAASAQRLRQHAPGVVLKQFAQTIHDVVSSRA
ncbi:MAG: glycosyltransferase [Pseudomonadales bacterium]